MASQDLKEQTELGNQGLQVSFLGTAAVQTRANKKVFDLQQSPKCRLAPFACCGVIALIGKLSFFPDCYCLNTETSTSKGAETHPWNKTWLDQEWYLALHGSSHHTKWAVLQRWVVMSTWHGTPVMLKSSLVPGWHRDITSYSLPPEVHKAP